MDMSLGGLFRCMLCTQPKRSEDLVFTHLSNQIGLIHEVVDRMESLV